MTIAASDFHLHTRRYTRRSGEGDRAPIEEHIEGVRFVWLWSAPHRRNDWRRGINWLTFARSLVRWAGSEDASDVVIGSSPHLLAAAAARRVARAWSVPFVFEVRDLWPESLLAAGGRRGPVYAGMRLVADHLYRRADRIIVLARGSGTYLRERRGVPPDSIAYVPNGVDPSLYGERQDRSPGELTLVYAGAHGPANGLGAVLEAADRLRDRPVRFRLVGDGPAKAELVREAGERRLEKVEFLDPVSKWEMPSLLHAADGGLMVLREAPLFSFGVSPNKLFDYFAAGLPVVCNVDGEVAGMVREAEAGELARPGSVDSLTTAIERLLDRSEAERRAMGDAARAWVAQHHARPILAARLAGVLDELVGR